MKKLLSAVLSATMLLSAMGVTTLAASYLATEAEPIKITVKKAAAADVVKDGKIGENEYEKFVFPSDTDDNQNPVPMTLVYGNDPDMYDYAENMSKTMESRLR